jgi:hypothetical protein
MKNNKSFFGLFVAALVLLPGCMRVPTYKSRPLQSVSNHCVHRDTEKNVIVQAKLLSREDKKTLFGDRSRLIRDNDIQVIHLSINNLSNVKYLFSPVDIDLSVMSCRDVEKLMKTSSVSKLAGSTVSGVFSWSSGVTAAFVIGDMSIASIPVLVVFLAPSVICAGIASVLFGKSIKSMVMNRRISKDLREKTLHKKVIINSGGRYEGLIFVRSIDYKPQFNVAMHEKGNSKNILTFDVDLNQNEQKE